MAGSYLADLCDAGEEVREERRETGEDSLEERREVAGEERALLVRGVSLKYIVSITNNQL